MVLEDLMEEIENYNSIELEDKEIKEIEEVGNILINQNRELLDINQ